jgi:hypothetical protein
LFDPHFGIVLRKTAANFVCLDPNYRIIRRVVIDGAAEHLGADHALSQIIQPPGQGVLNNQAEKVLGPLAARKRLTRENSFEMAADQTDALRAEALVWRR